MNNIENEKSIGGCPGFYKEEIKKKKRTGALGALVQRIRRFLRMK